MTMTKKNVVFGILERKSLINRPRVLDKENHGILDGKF
jgi:hypothetical protein